MKGITSLSRLSGHEHNQICRILLGLIVDLRLPDNQSPVRLIQAVRAVLDALYLSQYPLHSDETLEVFEDAINRFDDNKQIFIDLGIRFHFNINKFHYLRRHYINAIKLYGTTDNYNTEYTERLHIDLVKDAYRSTNRKDEYPQMTLWLERKEKIFRHETFLRWKFAGAPSPATWHPPQITERRHLQMTRYPSRKRVPLTELAMQYGAKLIREALVAYFIQLDNPGHLTRRQIELAAESWHLPFQSVAVYHKIKFWNQDSQGFSGKTQTLDAVHVKPSYKNKRGQIVPGRFDTVLIKVKNDADGVNGIHYPRCLIINAHILPGLRVAQVRAVFSIPKLATASRLHRGTSVPTHLAYIELFSPFPPQPDRHHGMYRIKRCFDHGQRSVAIVPVTEIERSAHLFPIFGPVAPREWSASTVLEQCLTFYVNLWSDRHAYITIR